MTKKTQKDTGTLNLVAIQKLVNEAQAPFANVVRLTPSAKQRTAKMKRGAHEILPLVAKLAQKYSVQAPGTSVADIQSNIDYAQSLEPLLGSVATLLETLKDAHLSAESAAWTTGTVSYGMMKKAAKANVNLANELAPVTEWFRNRAKGTKAEDTSATSTSARGSTSPSAAAVAPVAGPTAAQTAQPEVSVNGAPHSAATPSPAAAN
jgi:hypothetical protein